MTKDRIKQIIRECIQNTVNEGSSNRETYEQWDNIKNMIGSDTMLDEVFNYMSSDEIEDFIEHIVRNYEL